MAVKISSIRLTIDRASSEFCVDRRSLQRSLSEAEIQIGEDGKYSIRQIHLACAGNLEAEKIRETRHRANILEMEEAEKRGTLIDAEAVKALGEKVFTAIKSGILASSLLPDEKDDLLKQLQPMVGNAWQQQLKQ
jgi:phage terminase Nu1 subunit (DNA packaging protein)